VEGASLADEKTAVVTGFSENGQLAFRTLAA
jgi:hypothetical protein